MKSPKPQLLDQSLCNSASQGRSCQNLMFLVGNCAVTRGPIRGLYEVNTRSAHIAEPELPLGLGYVCAQTAAPPLTLCCQLCRCIHVGSHRLRLAAVWLVAALWGGGMHLFFCLRRSQSASSVVCVTSPLLWSSADGSPCRGMLGLCRMVGLFSRDGFGIMFYLVAS